MSRNGSETIPCKVVLLGESGNYKLELEHLNL